MIKALYHRFSCNGATADRPLNWFPTAFVRWFTHHVTQFNTKNKRYNEVIRSAQHRLTWCCRQYRSSPLNEIGLFALLACKQMTTAKCSSRHFQSIRTTQRVMLCMTWIPTPSLLFCYTFCRNTLNFYLLMLTFWHLIHWESVPGEDFSLFVLLLYY